MIPSITSVLSQRRLRWYGHVERSKGPINRALHMEVPGVRSRGRPKKTWMDSVKADIKNWKMPPCADARFEWRSTMNSSMQTCNPHLNGKSTIIE